jgi:hypothetical protein
MFSFAINAHMVVSAFLHITTLHTIEIIANLPACEQYPLSAIRVDFRPIRTRHSLIYIGGAES